MAAVEAALAPLLAVLESLGAKVDAANAKVNALGAKVAALEAARANDSVRVLNRLTSLTARLVPLRFDCAGAPWPADVEQPPTFESLATFAAPGG